jgi:hypothetical protein
LSLCLHAADQRQVTQHAPGLAVREELLAGEGSDSAASIHADAHIMSSAEQVEGRYFRLDSITSARPPPSIRGGGRPQVTGA